MIVPPTLALGRVTFTAYPYKSSTCCAGGPFELDAVPSPRITMFVVPAELLLAMLSVALTIPTCVAFIRTRNVADSPVSSSVAKLPVSTWNCCAPGPLKEMKKACQPHCFSTLNHIVGFCYNDARVIKWLFKQAIHGFQGVTNWSDD